MYKSWKLRAAVAGVAMAAAPMVLMSQAGAVPLAPTINSVTPTNGPAGTTVTVTASGCGSTATPATSGNFFLQGGTIPAATATVPGLEFPGTVSPGNILTGTVTIPSDARPTDTFTFFARCNDTTGQGALSAAGAQTFTPTAGTVTGALTTATGGVTGTGLTSTSGTTATGTATTAGVTTASATTSVATPITQTPTFTG